MRRLAQDLTHPLITTLQQECSRTTCPEMKAGEWLYLCVAHGNDGAMEVRFDLSSSTYSLTKSSYSNAAQLTMPSTHWTARLRSSTLRASSPRASPSHPPPSDISRPSRGASGASSRTRFSTTALPSRPRKLRTHCTPGF